MSENLLLPQFKARVACNSTTRDGFEVQNLISASVPSYMSGGTKPFMTESFVRPPVNVTFSFPFNVELEKIVLNPAVGSQKSFGFEIYTCTGAVLDGWLVTQGPHNAACKDKFMASNSKTVPDVFSCIGRALDREANIFQFNNSSFRQRRPFMDLSGLPGHTIFDGQKLCKTPFRPRQSQNLNNVSHLIIRITRTSSGICCLKWLEIWGQPSLSCTSALVQNVMQIRRTLAEKSRHMDSQNPAVPTAKVQGNPHDGVEEAVSLEIPRDFIDPITQEIMQQPVLLPSGQSVDQSTLEKFESSEAKWGRGPSDPFTGLSFTDEHKAIPNSSLKVRIDQFVLRHGTDLNISGRRLGGNEYPFRAGNQQVESTLVQKYARGSSKNDSEKSDKLDHKRKASWYENDSEMKRTKGDEDNVPSSSRRAMLEYPFVQRMNVRRSESSSESVSVPQHHSTRDHKESLKTSLQAAISGTLSHLPKYRRYTPTSTQVVKHSSSSSEVEGCSSEVTNIGSGCCACHAALQMSNDNIYRLSCNHVICRGCIVKIENADISCDTCNQKTARADVTRVHL